MTVCILGIGTMGSSLARSIGTKFDNLLLCNSTGDIEANLSISRFPTLKYGDFAKKPLFPNVEKCIITTRIDLLSLKQRSAIYDDIQAMAENGCKFLNLSSVAVYGSSRFPRTETSTLDPVNKYGEMKVKIEEDLSKMIRPENLINLRIANLYGNRGFRDLTNKILIQISLNQVVTIPENNPLRDFVYSKDLELFSIDWISSRIETSGNLNFATGSSYSTIDWIQFIDRILGTEIEFNAGYDENLQFSMISPDKLRGVWFEALTPVDVGLGRYLRTYLLDR